MGKIILVLFTLCCLSCAPKISLISEKYYSEKGAEQVLINGKTTESEVRKIYGSPEYIRGNSSYLVYAYSICPNPFSRDTIKISCQFKNGILEHYSWEYIRQ